MSPLSPSRITRYSIEFLAGCCLVVVLSIVQQNFGGIRTQLNWHTCMCSKKKRYFYSVMNIMVNPQTKYSIFYYITPFIDVIPRGKKFFPCGSLVNITVLPDLDLHMLDQTVTPSVACKQSVDKKFAGCKFGLTLLLIVS